MRGSPAAREYARFLMRLPPKERTAVMTYLRMLGLSVEKDVQLRDFLSHPAIDPKDKLRSLESTVPSSGGGLVHDLLVDIIRRGAIRLFGAIAEEMTVLEDAAADIRSVEVRSAVPLTSGAQKRLIERLKGYSGSEVKIRFAVDAGLIAGFLVKIGDTIIDNTVRTELENIRRRLMTASSP